MDNLQLPSGNAKNKQKKANSVIACDLQHLAVSNISDDYEQLFLESEWAQ